jgi:hypothetical protein
VVADDALYQSNKALAVVDPEKIIEKHGVVGRELQLVGT